MINIGIIGYGRFGKLWASVLSPYGKVKIFDKKKIGKISGVEIVSLKEVVNSDLLFLLVPIAKLESVCKKISKLLSKSTLVIGACSVKIYPAKVMKKFLPKSQPLVATHPLFGPDSVKIMGLSGQKIVVHPLRCNNSQLKSFEDILKKMNLKIIHATPKIHDEQMANSQALVHFLGRGLAALNLKEQEIATPDYKSLLRIHDLVNNDTWELFYNMERINPYAKKVRQKLLNKLSNLEFEIGKVNDIKSLRKIIDYLDKEIIVKISRRFEVAEKIGMLKKRENKTVLDKGREMKLKNLHKRWSKKLALNNKIVKKMFDLLMLESKKIQLDTRQPRRE